MSGRDALTADEDIDVLGVLAALRRRWWLIVLVALMTGVGMFFLLSSMDDKYRSTARLLVKDGSTTFTRTTSERLAPTPTNQLDQQAVRSEVEIIYSSLLASRVIKELELEKVREFSKDANAGNFLTSIVPGSKNSSEVVQQSILKKFRERLSVYAIEQSRVIVVEFWAHDPVLAQQIVASLTNEYLKFKIAERIDGQQNATSWLDPRIKELEDALNQKEAAVAEYRASEDLLRVDDKNALLATQQLSQISTELSRLKAERSSTQARVASIRSAIRSGASIEVIPEVLQSNLIQRLREREVDLEARISDLSITLLPNHPRLKSLNSQLVKLRRQIRSAAEDVVTSLERNVAATKDAEADLAKEIIRLKSEAARVDSKLVELRAREREAQAARDLLAEYKSRSLEAKSREGLAQANAEIISPATLPDEAFFPKVVPFTIAGTLAVALLTMLLIIASNLLVSARRPDELTDAMVAELSKEYEKEHKESSDVKAEPAPPLSKNTDSDPYPPTPRPPAPLEIVAVRHAARAISEAGPCRLAVISPSGPVGSTSARVLARHLAARGRKVVAIDMTREASTTIDMIGDRNAPGFFNLLSGSVSLGGAIHKDKSTQAHIVPPGSLFPNQPSPTAEAVSSVVDSIAAHFEYCILDCGDVELVDLNVVADDGTVAIISAAETAAEELRRRMDELKLDGYDEVLLVKVEQEDMRIAVPAMA